jgi:hypothetical protein
MQMGFRLTWERRRKNIDRRPIYGRSILALALVAIGLQVQAADESSQTVHLLKPMAGTCDGLERAEKLAMRRKDKTVLEVLEVMGESDVLCAPNTEYERIWGPVISKLGTGDYVCFVLWPVDRPNPPTSRQNEFCSELEGMTTLQRVLGARKGDFTIFDKAPGGISGGYVRAKCADGGSVTIMKRGSQWLRNSALGINAPVNAPKKVREADGLATVISAGCLGEDYKQ